MKWEKISANNIFGKGCISVKAWAAATVQKRSWEELPHVRGRGSGWECQAAMVQEQPKGATPRPRPGAVARRSYPTSKVRGGGREEKPHVQGAVAARAQEGLEELSHVEGQEGRPWGDTPHPRWGDTPRPR